MTEPSPANSRFLAFGLGTGRDHLGRTREEIVGWDNEPIERVHDFIQCCSRSMNPVPSIRPHPC